MSSYPIIDFFPRAEKKNVYLPWIYYFFLKTYLPRIKNQKKKKKNADVRNDVGISSFYINKMAKEASEVEEELPRQLSSNCCVSTFPSPKVNTWKYFFKFFNF